MAVSTVDSEARWYELQKERWEVAKTLLGGTEMMRTQQQYLPKFSLESSEAYIKRLHNTVLTNTYLQIAQRMVGLMFREPLEIKDSKIPDDLINNIDNCGKSLHSFVEDLAFHTLTRGIHHIFVDAPKKKEGVTTLAQEKAAGIRPFWLSIPAEICFNAAATHVNNEEILLQVRYRDDKTVLDGWDVGCIEQIRVLSFETGVPSYELWERVGKNKRYVLVSDSKGFFEKVTRIPFVTVYGGRREAFMTARSVIQDIAYKNIEHWQSSSDQRNILTVSRYPMMYQIGIPTPIMASGPHIALHSPGNPAGPEVKFGYIEPQGQGVVAGERDLARIIDEIEMLALQLRVDTRQSATGAVIDHGSTTSNLVTVAQGLENAVNQALEFTAEYLGLAKGEGGKIEINKDYSLSADETKRLETLVKMREDGDLSRETYWEQMVDAGVLTGDFDAEKEKTLLEGNI